MLTTESHRLPPETDWTPDAGWLAGIRARNRDSLEHLYRKYSPQVIQFLSLVEPDRAPSEACLDVFEEVWYRAVGSPPHGSAADWILSLAYGVLLERSRSPDTLPSPGPTLRGDPRRMIRALSWEQRVVVALVYGSGASLESISQVTGMTREEITGCLSQARARLRR